MKGIGCKDQLFNSELSSCQSELSGNRTRIFRAFGKPDNETAIESDN
ncbi:hypothetical protein C4K04_2336 [Pseudomonas chlororaphis]|uniref:Uncharacterized protein n=1 Tax=Pseudomonas chlororaphis TaxID=587753 RepID=A0A3G7TLX9_9PSED|nr:hypothetical protein C4K04_2336 [Pseudomonas chlororaphis]